MNIVYISYWGIDEGLTKATVLPHIKILSQFSRINKIYFFTIDRDRPIEYQPVNSNIIHIPIGSRPYLLPLVNKLKDIVSIPILIARYIRSEKVDKVIARGTLAGSIAYLIWLVTKTPFYVESFEPHADYMRETGVWSKWDPRYLLLKKLEKNQFFKAAGIMTVTKNYTDFLTTHVSENIPVITVPCAVDLTNFGFSTSIREKERSNLGIEKNQIVGIYAGKFGGLYIDISELHILKKITKFYKNVCFIILTPHYHQISKRIKTIFSLSEIRIIVKKVAHHEVPAYLSASDFAMSLNKSFDSGKYLSPVKIGEYWANGLPVLMTRGIGDENEFIEPEKGGVLFELNNIQPALEKLRKIIDDPDHRKRIPQLAVKYRSFERVREAYTKMIIN
jgi:glycosyltransferase involved in cell wall biosynthesis